MALKKSFIMIAAICSAVLGFSVPHIIQAQGEQIFKDIGSYPFASAIEFLQQQNIVSPDEEKYFRPKNLITRADFARFLVKAVVKEDPEAPNTTCFLDIEVSLWPAKYVCYAAEKKWMRGQRDGRFLPREPIAFQEAAEAMALAFNLTSGGVQGLNNSKAIPGTILNLQHLLTRGETAEILTRLIKKDTAKASLGLCELEDKFCTNFVPFVDVYDSKPETAIRFLQKRGIVSGYSGNVFKPDAYVNRSEFVKILLEALGINAGKLSGQNNCFPDVTTAWYAPYVCYAKQQGMIRGRADGRFHPDENVLLTEAFRTAIQGFGHAVTKPQSGQEWFRPYVDFAHANNIFSKFSKLPSEALTRGEMARLIYILILDREGLVPLIHARDNLSLGCGKNPPRSPPASSLVNGLQHDYITYIPPSYNKDTPLSLTFVYHGRITSNEGAMNYGNKRDSKGTSIIIAPAGFKVTESSWSWDLGRDVPMFDQVIEEIAELYCINLDQIYVNGHSMGAGFSTFMACRRGDTIRAFGSVGGGGAVGRCTGPVAAMLWHSPYDKRADFGGSVAARDQFLKINHCSNQVVPIPNPPRDSSCVEYQSCDENAPLIWCPFNSDERFATLDNHGFSVETFISFWRMYFSLDGLDWDRTPYVCSGSGCSLLDIEEHRYREAIEFARDEKIIAGYADKSYRPDIPVNRAELAKILMEAKIAGTVPAPENDCFPDVSMKDWFAKYVCFAKKLNIVSGYADYTYKPANFVKASEAAKMIVKSFDISIDENNAEQWYAPYFKALQNSFPETILQANQEITRGELAAIILALHKQNLIPSPQKACELVEGLSCLEYSLPFNTQINTMTQEPNFAPREQSVRGKGWRKNRGRRWNH